MGSRPCPASADQERCIEQRERNGAFNGGIEQLTRYAYDEADRLTGQVAPDCQVAYMLDAVGNRRTEQVRTAADVLIGDSTLTYNARDQLTERDDPVGGLHVELDYDANGNAHRQVDASGERTFTYDARDRLLTLAQPNAPPLGFDYQSDGLRLAKRQGGSETRYQYDQRSLLAETNAIGNTLARYHYGANQLVSRTEAGSTPTHRHYLLDALQTPIALLTQQGAVSARTRYDAWGAILAQQAPSGTVTTPDPDGTNVELANTDQQPIGFTGYLKDIESGLYYAKARYYDPRIARFTTEDPERGDILQPPSLHRYLYAYANPTVYVDPTGRITILIAPADDIDEFSAASLAIAKDFAGAMADASWYHKPGLVVGWAAAGTGYIGGNAVNGARGLVNAAANALVIAGDALASTASPGGNALSPLADEARTEINAFVEQGAPTIEAFSADWRSATIDVVMAASAAAVDTTRRVAEGDSQAILDVASNLNPHKLAESMGSTVRRAVKGPPIGAPHAATIQETVDGGPPNALAQKQSASADPGASGVAQLPAIRFLRWKRGDAIDKPMPDGSVPAWGVIQSRYWKNRAESALHTDEFSRENLRRMQRGVAPQDFNPRTGIFESRELHHVVPRRANGRSDPLNLRELTPDQHGAVDPYRHTVPTTSGIL